MRTSPYNSSAPKKATNLSINAELLAEAKSLNINLSQTLEQRLEELVREGRRKEWLRQNRAALDAYNRRIERIGVFSEGLRRF
jgi:antitoxin CcdA